MIGGNLCFDLKFLDELFPPEFMGYTAPKGFLWKVVFDPTRNGEDPGLFYGSLFRLLDILPTWDETSPWPDGIVFEHIQTGQRLTFLEGQSMYLNLPEEIIKRRLRNRKDKEASFLAVGKANEQGNSLTCLEAIHA
jgi:hypothetical protein